MTKFNTAGKDDTRERETKTYLFSYFHDNTWWSIEINAYSEQDAHERLLKFPSARYDGELQLKIYVPNNN